MFILLGRVLINTRMVGCAYLVRRNDYVLFVTGWKEKQEIHYLTLEDAQKDFDKLCRACGIEEEVQ